MVWLLPTKTQIVQHLDTYLSDPNPVVVAHAAKDEHAPAVEPALLQARAQPFALLNGVIG